MQATIDSTQAKIDAANAQFWNEICGSGLARHIGITDHSMESLRKFDQAYLDMYPYLLPIIGPNRMAGKKVLEIGLGYGTVGQAIAQAGADYTGLDIAEGPVRLLKDRLRLQGMPGTARTGSALEMPFAAETFDHVVSIGCFHHTGNVQRCLDETYRVLKPGGSAVLMVYNKYSLRQWSRWPKMTFRAMVKEWLPGWIGTKRATYEQIQAYDAGASGNAAPETVFLSIGDLKRMLRQYESKKFYKRNCDPIIRRGKMLADRPKLLGTVGVLLGLDIYFEARKSVVAVSVARRAA